MALLPVAFSLPHGTQTDGAPNVPLLAEVIVFPVCSLTSLLPSSHCSRYSTMNLKSRRTEKYIKILCTELAVSEILGGSSMNQVYSLFRKSIEQGIHYFKHTEIESILNICVPVTRQPHLSILPYLRQISGERNSF